MERIVGLIIGSIMRRYHFHICDGVQVFDSLGTNTVVATMDTPISADNIGFRLVAKMGWSQGMGLGKGQRGKTGGVAGSALVFS